MNIMFEDLTLILKVLCQPWVSLNATHLHVTLEFNYVFHSKEEIWLGLNTYILLDVHDIESVSDQ
jgi:hypothetical protein